MIKLLMLLIVLLASVWLGIQLNHDPGYVLIAINHWTIETTLWVGLFILFTVFCCLHLLLNTLSYIADLPSGFKRWRAKRRLYKARATTRQGLIEFSEGYWSAAQQHLIKALPNADAPLLNYLTAARAAQEMGNNQLRDDYLREAQQSVPDAKIAVKLTQAQLQLADHQWEQALATLRHLQELTPHHPYVLKLLMNLYQDVDDWPQLIQLLPDLKKYAVLPPDDYAALRRLSYCKALSQLIKQQATEAIAHFIDKLPRDLKLDADIMGNYCDYLIQNQQENLAEVILKNCLRKHYNDKLITLYGRIHVNEKQLIFAESLLKKHSSPALYICLGRLSNASSLWGKAKAYFEQSNALHPNAETYWEIGRLYDRFGETDLACRAYEQGLRLDTRIGCV